MNRYQRRHLSATPSKGSQPVKVSREVPVAIINSAAGQEVVELDTAEPCYGCKCCVVWGRSLDTLRESMLEHEQGQHTAPGPAFGVVTRLPGCLVCQLLDGAADGN